MMRITAIAATLALTAAGSAVAEEQATTGPDTFAINIDLEQLQTMEGAKEFDNRLARDAQRYCYSEAPTASSSSQQVCTSRVISAVEAAVLDAAEEEGTPIAWRSAGL